MKKRLDILPMAGYFSVWNIVHNFEIAAFEYSGDGKEQARKAAEEFVARRRDTNNND